MTQKFVSPTYHGLSFHCPHCGVLAHQIWREIWHRPPPSGGFSQLTGWMSATCAHCHNTSVWHAQNMIFPISGTAPLPHEDLPNDIALDYSEARDIANRSPRGAAALLRLALQKLCAKLGGKGTSINDDIAILVADGLPKNVQKSLDSVRVIGNEAVHPGTIDLKDDATTVAMLFHLVNFITEKMISEPKQIEGIYEMLPPEKIKAIEARDAKKKV